VKRKTQIRLNCYTAPEQPAGHGATAVMDPMMM
jgi:hypothetical protein